MLLDRLAIQSGFPQLHPNAAPRTACGLHNTDLRSCRIVTGAPHDGHPCTCSRTRCWGRPGSGCTPAALQT